jgi:hypothetical protein
MKTLCANPDYMKGEWLVVFDAQAWKGKDVGDNTQFWKAARVVECYWKDGDQLVDVRFIDNMKAISRGHFLHAASSVTPYWRERINAL